jgi:hypothetical protein
MATHTESGKGSYGRKFSISRENGQVDKDGRPYFFEWAKEIPAQPGKRKFETRTSAKGERHYELFSALDGYLIDVREEMKDLGKGMEAWLILTMIDADDEYQIEVGRIDERYSMDIMKRLLNPNFNPNQKLRLAPYAVKDEKSQRWNIGISAYSGVDKLEHSQNSDFLRGIHRAESREWKGKTEWDFSPVAKWLFDKVNTLVVPNLMKDPVSAPKKAATTFDTGAASFPTTDLTDHEKGAEPEDTLPF